MILVLEISGFPDFKHSINDYIVLLEHVHLGRAHPLAVEFVVECHGPGERVVFEHVLTIIEAPEVNVVGIDRRV